MLKELPHFLRNNQFRFKVIGLNGPSMNGRAEYFAKLIKLTT